MTPADKNTKRAMPPVVFSPRMSVLRHRNRDRLSSRYSSRYSWDTSYTQFGGREARSPSRTQPARTGWPVWHYHEACGPVSETSLSLVLRKSRWIHKRPTGSFRALVMLREYCYKISVRTVRIAKRAQANGEKGGMRGMI